MVHCGTLIPILVVFRKDLVKLVSGGVSLVRSASSTEGFKGRFKEELQARLLVFIALACVPAGLVGFLFKDLFEHLFSSVLAVGVSLLVTGTLLVLTRFVYHTPGSGKPIRFVHAFLIGCAQALAITPGISRSGATIATALLLGINREMAGRFSFLIFIPAIAGAIILNGRLPESYVTSYLLTIFSATITAALTGYAALKILLRFVHRGKIHYFAPYCYVLGLVAIIVSL